MSELWSAAQLAVFARVVELNGFSAAARAYRVPKVAISRAIADLEKSIGCAAHEAHHPKDFPHRGG